MQRATSGAHAQFGSKQEINSLYHPRSGYNNLYPSQGWYNIYVTIYRKKALVAQITQIELLVALECAF